MNTEYYKIAGVVVGAGVVIGGIFYMTSSSSSDSSFNTGTGTTYSTGTGTDTDTGTTNYSTGTIVGGKKKGKTKKGIMKNTKKTRKVKK